MLLLPSRYTSGGIQMSTGIIQLEYYRCHKEMYIWCTSEVYPILSSHSHSQVLIQTMDHNHNHKRHPKLNIWSTPDVIEILMHRVIIKTCVHI